MTALRKPFVIVSVIERFFLERERENGASVTLLLVNKVERYCATQISLIMVTEDESKGIPCSSR